MTTVEKEIKRKYNVKDLCGVVRRFDKLKDARQYLREELGYERYAHITAETVETIVIRSEDIIQTNEKKLRSLIN